MMRNLRWATYVCVAAVALSASLVRADIASDLPAALVIYPSIKVGKPGSGQDTAIRLVNTSVSDPILLYCFYLDTNSHCVGGPEDGQICTGQAQICEAPGTCSAQWVERDFRVELTVGQPIEWLASQGLADDRLPLPTGVCVQNASRTCGTDADCNPFPGGACSQSNAGTRIPEVGEVPFTGELRCLAIDENGAPVPRNDLIGDAVIETATKTGLDVASYNAVGVPASGTMDAKKNQLLLGGSATTAEYSGCPNALILDHFFDTARSPVPNTNDIVTTNLVLVTCTDNTLTQSPGRSIVQYLVFNEFEQRFSTSNSIRGFRDTQLCKIDTRDCTRSIWNVNVQGTLTGQTEILPVTSGSQRSGLVGIAVEKHVGATTNTAAFNLQFKGTRPLADTLTIPGT